MKASTLEALISFSEAEWGAVQLFHGGLTTMPSHRTALTQLLRFIKHSLHGQVSYTSCMSIMLKVRVLQICAPGLVSRAW